jgi:hypothetical protein
MQHTKFWQTLRNWSGVVALPLLIVLVLAGSAFRIAENNRQAEQQRQELFEISCLLAESDQVQLKAQKRVARALGLPDVIVIPEVPAECESG